MGLQIDSIITLENDEKYIVLNDTIYENEKYCIAMGVAGKNEIIPDKVAILKEILDGNELYVEKVSDQDLVVRLTKILKEQL